MNYLVKTKEGKFIVMSKVTKDWSQYIGSKSFISIGKEKFQVIQEIEIR